MRKYSKISIASCCVVIVEPKPPNNFKLLARLLTPFVPLQIAPLCALDARAQTSGPVADSE